jgi:hypothetical protein
VLNAAGQMRRPFEPSAALDWIDSPEVVRHLLLYFLNAKIIANPLSFVP